LILSHPQGNGVPPLDVDWSPGTAPWIPPGQFKRLPISAIIARGAVREIALGQH
jgi:hypothetical protein